MGNREEYYVYDGNDVVLDFVDANGATGGVNPVLKTRYLHGPAVDQILAQEEINTTAGDSADVLWMLTDHLGSVRDIVNQAGEAVSHVTYGEGKGDITRLFGTPFALSYFDLRDQVS